MTNEEVFKAVLDCSFRVHSALGAGLLESSYEECLFYELNQVGLFAEKQKPLPLVYHDIKLDIGYRVDILVEKKSSLKLNLSMPLMKSITLKS